MKGIAHKKGIMSQETKERAKQMELIKVKSIAKTKKVEEKQKRKLTLEKWKEDDNGGQREKNLQLIRKSSPYSSHTLYGENFMLSHHKVNQNIAKAKLIAKNKKNEM